MGLLSSAALYFLGFPAPAAATLVGAFLASIMLVVEQEPWSALTKTLTLTTTLVSTQYRIVTVTNNVLKTSVILITSTVTNTVVSSITVTKKVTYTVNVTKFICGKVVTLSSTWLEGPLRCPQTLYCVGPKDVIVYYGRNLSLRPYVLVGNGATVLYTPEGTWELAHCNRTLTVEAGESLALARPYYGQPPATITIIRMTTESRRDR